MSNAGHFNSKHVQLNKVTGKEIKTFEDFPAARIRHHDGSHADYKGGKMIAGTHVVEAPKKTAKKDVPGGESKFFKPTEISTIVERTRDEKETAGESETGARVRKKIDVNARALKL